MAEETARIGAGRPYGVRDPLNRELVSAIEAAPGASLEEKLIAVFDNTELPTRVRLEALRRETHNLSLRVLIGAK